MGISDSAPSNTSNAVLTYFSSFFQAFIQSMLPFSLLIYIVLFNWCLPFLGTQRTYLVVCSQYMALILVLIFSRFFSVWGTHHSKSGCESTIFSTTNSERSTMYESLTSFNVLQDVLLDFHWMHNSQPQVVVILCLFSLWETINASIH